MTDSSMDVSGDEEEKSIVMEIDSSKDDSIKEEDKGRY